MSRKASETSDGGEIEVWGDGKQTRSFLYIDDCVEAVLRFVRQDAFLGPVNIGSEEMIAINDFAKMTIDISGKDIKIKNVDVPQVGVRGRNSDNTVYRKHMNWEVSKPLVEGMRETYEWINSQVNK
jgi:nucleoside-diphosphate-sugar epimerase